MATPVIPSPESSPQPGSAAADQANCPNCRGRLLWAGAIWVCLPCGQTEQTRHAPGRVPEFVRAVAMRSSPQDGTK